MESLENRFQEAKRAFEAEEYGRAFMPLLWCANRGHAEAQSIVGFMHYMGQGTERSLPEAIAWLTKAIDQGRGEAAHNLATLYLTCEPEMPNNPEESRRLYLKARELGFVVAPDEWYEKLSDKGSAS